jgi:hypothetical protein
VTIHRPHACGDVWVRFGLFAVGAVLIWIVRTLVRDIRAGIA